MKKCMYLLNEFDCMSLDYSCIVAMKGLVLCEGFPLFFNRCIIIESIKVEVK